MSDQQSFMSGDPYVRHQASERMLNTAITQARISESFEEYLEIFNTFMPMTYRQTVKLGMNRFVDRQVWGHFP